MYLMCNQLLAASWYVQMLSMYDIISAVEPVDAWRPKANLYESGEIACIAPLSARQTSHFASKSSFLTVSTNQNEAIQEKSIWVSAQPVIVGI